MKQETRVKLTLKRLEEVLVEQEKLEESLITKNKELDAKISRLYELMRQFETNVRNFEREHARAINAQGTALRNVINAPRSRNRTI